MKKLLLILLILSSFYVKGDIHQIQVWNGYYQFLPSNNITVQLGDTIQWVPLDPPTMNHTITSDNIPNGAIPFDQIWQLPADTFFQYIPQVVGLYQYVCTPHITFGMIGEFTVVNGPQTYVPDDNFEAYLEANGMGNGIANDDYVTTANINTVTFLNINNQNIADLTGIEYFTTLDSLYCEYNQLTSLDVSNNTYLFNMRCGNNQLITLDVSQNQNLKFLYCEDNQIASLDLSGAVNLQDIYCEHNQLTSLDVSNNVLLKWLMCYQNQIGLLDISNLTILSDFDCSYNNIASLDISNNIQLIALDCHDNNLTLLDMRNGNNQNMDLNTSNNINLTCISVDDSTWSNTNWTAANGNIDTQHYFSFDCAFIPSSWNCINNACVDPLDGSGFFTDSLSCISSCIQTEISDQINNSKQELIRIIDVLGRETTQTNQPLFYIYDDGTVEKRIVIE